MTSLKLVSALEQFNRQPSSETFLQLLKDLSTKRLTTNHVDQALRQELEARLELPFVFNSTSVQEFDQRLWQIIREISIPIPWADDNETSGDQAGEKPDAITDPKITSLVEAVKAVAGAEVIEEARTQSAREATGHKLDFFADVSQLLAQDQETFDRTLTVARELEDLLISYGTASSQFHGSRGIYCDPENWGWIGKAILRAYAAGLKSLTSEFKIDKKAATHISISTKALLVFGTAAVAGKDLHISLIDEVLNYKSGLESDVGIIARYRVFALMFPLVSSFISDSVRQCEKSADHDDAIFQSLKSIFFTITSRSEANNFRTVAEAKSKLLQSLFYANTCHLYVDEAFLQFIHDCWLSDRYEIRDLSDSADTVFGLVRAYVWSLTHVDKNSDLIELLTKALQLNADSPLSPKNISFELSRLGAFKTKQLELWCYLLREAVDFGETRDDIGVDDLAERLVKTTNDDFSRTGMPMIIPLAQSFSGFGEVYEQGLEKRSIYYQSISTIAVNLGSSERRHEHFSGTNSTRAFLNATKCIADAGYHEHATVFLGYALIRQAFFSVDRQEIVVSLLDRALREFLDDRYARRHLPALLGVVEHSANLTPAYRIWLHSYKSQSPRPPLTLLKFPKDIEPKETELKLPLWFGDGTETLRSHIVDIKAALAEQGKAQEADWRAISRKYRVREGIAELLRQLEAELKYVLRDTFDAFCRDPQLQDIYGECVGNQKLMPIGNSASFLSWGWIEKFLSGLVVIHDGKVRAASIERLVATANRNVEGLGQVISNMRHQEAAIRLLRRAREADNELSHNQPIPRRQAARDHRVKPTIPLAEATWLYHYCMVDFGELYVLLEPLIVED